MSDYPCVDESWHSWKARDMSRQIADGADHAMDLEKDGEDDK